MNILLRLVVCLYVMLGHGCVMNTDERMIVGNTMLILDCIKKSDRRGLRYLMLSRIQIPENLFNNIDHYVINHPKTSPHFYQREIATDLYTKDSMVIHMRWWYMKCEEMWLLAKVDVGRTTLTH